MEKRLYIYIYRNSIMLLTRPLFRLDSSLCPFVARFRRWFQFCSNIPFFGKNFKGYFNLLKALYVKLLPMMNH
jgi:hypothetical protein